MGNEPRNWAAIVSNVLQWCIALGAIAFGCFAFFVASHLLGRIIIKLLMFGVPIAMTAAIAMGSKK